MAGLSAGSYSQMNGYHTRIFEMHSTPAGVVTTWSRKGYKIDGCIHWLTGSKPGNSFYPFWEELGIVQGLTMIDHEEYARIEGKEGKTFIVYTDIDRLEQHMKDLAPEDDDIIEEFTNGSIPKSVMSGRNVSQIICKMDKRKFVTSIPSNLKLNKLEKK